MSNQWSRISVAVAGASGKMGREALAALQADARFTVSAVLVRDPKRAPALSVVGHASGSGPNDGRAFAPQGPDLIFTDAEQLLREVRPDVWLDFTDAGSVVTNIDMAIQHGVRPVVGATGYSSEDLRRWDEALREASLGGVAVPNFALGALLMMRFAAEAARFFGRAEIVELHHDGKKDAPSGTARRTAEAMSEPLGCMPDEIPIHSVRLPGLVAHQEVLFGGTGEVLTIRHDSLSRSCFMPGVLIACAQVVNLTGMVYGLEHLLW